MKDFLNKYQIQIKILAIIIWAILAVNRWIMFSQSGYNQDRFSAVLWTTMALYYTLNFIIALRDKKFAKESELNNSKESSE